MLAETVCSAVSAAGLGIAVVTAYRRRFLAAARIAAYSLIPVGLAMTGIVKWAVNTAFSPTAWVGFGVLGVALLLLMITRAIGRRRGGAGRQRGAAVESAERGAVAPAPSARSLGPAASRANQPQATPARGRSAGGGAGDGAGSGGGEDFSDIEAILKKHGI